MPKILFVVPCETVLIGQKDMASLINLLSEIQYGNLPEIVPTDAALPFRWSIFAEWALTEDESKLNWEQRFRLLDPQNNPTNLQHVAEMLPSEGKPRHRMIVQLTHFPILPPGEYQVEVSIRTVGTEEWTAAGAYPLRIKKNIIITS